MLHRLLALLTESKSGMSLAELSRALNAQPSAVKPMLDFLVQKGKALEIGPDDKICATCGLEADCNLLKARGKRYIAAPS